MMMVNTTEHRQCPAKDKLRILENRFNPVQEWTEKKGESKQIRRQRWQAAGNKIGKTNKQALISNSKLHDSSTHKQPTLTE